MIFGTPRRMIVQLSRRTQSSSLLPIRGTVTWKSRLPYLSFVSTHPLHVSPLWLRDHVQVSAHARRLDENITKEEEEHYDRAVAHDKEKQIRTPWQREGSDTPPLARHKQAGAMTKGKLLTTPSRLLKLILPLNRRDVNANRKDVEPLALLVHPQQPLSYLERLIQAELPYLEQNDKEKFPAVNFSAVDFGDDGHSLRKTKDKDEEEFDPVQDVAVKENNQPGTSSDAPEFPRFVRWSKSTEIGAFIQDAARGKEFAVEIEGASQIRVGVPGFSERSYYLRIRLRKRARQLATMADIKAQCDELAHKSGQRLAYAGFGAIAGWGVIVYWLTFMTNYGWELMEPITYLVGLAGFLGGYVWVLFNKREASYHSALHLTVSRRQNTLYNMKGLDINRWQYLLDECNTLRKEIINIATEYDVEWDETADEQDPRVVEALKEHRKKKATKKEDEEKDDDDDMEVKESTKSN